MRARGFENIRLQSEDVSEFDYAPGHCRRSYRVVVLIDAAALLRTLAWLLQDAALATKSIIIEVILVVILLLAATRLCER